MNINKFSSEKEFEGVIGQSAIKSMDTRKQLLEELGVDKRDLRGLSHLINIVENGNTDEILGLTYNGFHKIYGGISLERIETSIQTQKYIGKFLSDKHISFLEQIIDKFYSAKSLN